MKRLILLSGPPGVGKSAVGKRLKMKLERSVFLDGDWCWDLHPFVVNEETKRLARANIRALLGNFLKSPAVENIVFCWVMHADAVERSVLEGLDLTACKVFSFSLICGEETLRFRLQKDVRDGVRAAEILARAPRYLPLFAKRGNRLIDTEGRTPEEIAGQIFALSGE